jgi:hypothetical protein
MVLATAHAVSEGILRRLAGDLARKASPQGYGASGPTTGPDPKRAAPLALSRTLGARRTSEPGRGASVVALTFVSPVSRAQRSMEREAPSAKRQARSAKREAPSAKRQARSAKREAPSAQWCAAEPGPLRAPRLERSRVGGKRRAESSVRNGTLDAAKTFAREKPPHRQCNSHPALDSARLFPGKAP